MKKDKMHTKGSQETWSPKTNQVCDSYEYFLVLNFARVWWPVVWSNTSLDVTAKVFFKIRIDFYNQLIFSKSGLSGRMKKF